MARTAWCISSTAPTRNLVPRAEYISLCFPPTPRSLLHSCAPPRCPSASASRVVVPHVPDTVKVTMSTSIDQAERLQRTQSRSSGSDSIAKVDPTNVNADVHIKDPEKASAAPVDEEEEDVSTLTKLYRRFRPFVLAALAAVILGWWITSTILPATRHRWCVFSVLSRGVLAAGGSGACARSLLPRRGARHNFPRASRVTDLFVTFAGLCRPSGRGSS